MGNSLSRRDREFIWIHLADFFTTADVESSAGFARLADFALSDLREIFFGEVAIACGHNLLVTTPLLSEGFDPDWVQREIAKVMSWRERGAFSKGAYMATRLLYRFLCGRIWREVEAALARIPRSPTPRPS